MQMFLAGYDCVVSTVNMVSVWGEKVELVGRWNQLEKAHITAYQLGFFIPQTNEIRAGECKLESADG